MTTTPTPKAPIRARDLAALVATVPSLLGFVPERSVVAVFIGANRRVTLTMRVDLGEARSAGMAATTVQAARQANAAEIILVGYVQRPGPVLAECLRDIGIAVENATMDDPDPLIVTRMAMVGQEHWAEVPTWSGQAPTRRPLAELHDHAVVAQSIYAGQSVAPSREALGRRFELSSEAQPEGYIDGYREAAEHMRGLAGHERAALVSAILDDVELSEPVTYPKGETLGWLLALVRDGQARDAASTRIRKESATRWLDFWSAVCRATAGEQAVVPLALVGLAAWLKGDGASANIAVDRAAAIEPGQPLVVILRSCLAHGLPPQMWDALVSTFEGMHVETENVEDEPDESDEQVAS